MKDKGLLKFIFEVLIPSVTAYWVDEVVELPYNYLSLSWEYEASQLGGDSDISGITTTYTPSVLEILGYLF